MPHNIIRDPTTGHQVAYSDENGKVFDAATGEFIALLQHDGNLYSLDGGLLGHVETTDKAEPGTAPPAFMELLKKK